MLNSIDEDDFVVVLPSNSNLDTHPNNKPADYTVRLETPIELASGDDWEVAIMSAQYPHNWYNYQENATLLIVCHSNDGYSTATNQSGNATDTEALKTLKFDILNDMNKDPNSADTMIACVKVWGVYNVATKNGNKFKTSDVILNGKNSNERHRFMVYGVRLGKAHYDTVEALGNKVVSLFNKYGNGTTKLSFHYNPGSCRCEFRSDEPVVMLANNAYFGKMLGLNQRKIDAPQQLHMRAELAAEIGKWYHVDLQADKAPQWVTNSALYVYTDIIEYQRVGNTRAPLLGIIPVTSNYGNQAVHWVFNPQTYVRTNRVRIPEIRIVIKTQRGEPLPFPADSEPVICSLRFRKKKLYR